MQSMPLFLEPGQPLPPVERPFSVLLDADDGDWANNAALHKTTIALLEAGCRWFVCFGEGSEDVHDRIDDTIVEQSFATGKSDYEGVVTTFHAEEPIGEVAEFFVNCALQDIDGALILVRDKEAWEAVFRQVAVSSCG